MVPFIKYVGGKRRLAKEILPLFPKVINKYIEPFCGGCAIAFALNHHNSFLSDFNSALIRCYHGMISNPEKVYKLYNKLNSKKLTRPYYKYILNLANHPWVKPFEYASYYIYLNKHSYMGMDTTKSGVGYFYFNTGTNLILEKDNFFKICEFFKKSKVESKSYVNLEINKDSFYYLDPPYFGVSSVYTNSFYHRAFFEFIKKIDKAGARFLMSNSDSTVIREYFKEFNIKTLKAKHQNHRDKMLRLKDNIKKVGEDEIVILNY